MRTIPKTLDRERTDRVRLELGQRTAALKHKLDAFPGAISNPMAAPRASAPGILIYKVMGKMFAILSIRGVENVILKCDPNLAHVLREHYVGVGHGPAQLDQRESRR